MEELVLLCRVWFVLIQKHSREPATRKLGTRATEVQPIVALQYLHILVAEIEECFAIVINHPTDVALKELARFILKLPQLLRRVNPQCDTITLGNELVVNEELLAVAHVKRSDSKSKQYE